LLSDGVKLKHGRAFVTQIARQKVFPAERFLIEQKEINQGMDFDQIKITIH
jgi:hypothetical protein